MTGLPQAVSAERIEKAARAIAVLDGLNWDAPPSSNIDINRPLYRQRAEAALRAAYPELADGRSDDLDELERKALAAVEDIGSGIWIKDLEDGKNPTVNYLVVAHPRVIVALIERLRVAGERDK